MEEPRLRSSRLVLAGSLAAVLAVGGGGFLLGRSMSKRPAIDNAPVGMVTPAASEAASAVGVRPRRALDRTDILALATASADAAAAGRAPP